MKRVAVDLPYPSLKTITPDVESARIIAPAFSGTQGEISAVLSYTYREFRFDYVGNEETAGLISGIAMAEMSHVEILGKTLIRLGVNPIYTANPPYLRNFYNTSEIAYATAPEKMVMDSLCEELNAISSYKKMVSLLRNEEVSAIIERILLDEMLHAEKLRELLEKMNGEKA